MMAKQWTAQVCYATYHTRTVRVEAETLKEALERAIEKAEASTDAPETVDDIGESFIDAVCEGYEDSASSASAKHVRIPDAFGEHGKIPLVRIDARPGGKGSVEVTNGCARIEFVGEGASITSKVCENAKVHGRTPVVSVRTERDGRLNVNVSGGRARVRIDQP